MVNHIDTFIKNNLRQQNPIQKNSGQSSGL